MVVGASVLGMGLIALGLYQLLESSFGMVSPSALAYLGAGVPVQVGLLTLLGLRTRKGRILLLASSVAFLQAAFLWTCGLGLPFTNELFLTILRMIEGLALTAFGTVSWSFQALDLSFLFALSVCMVSLFLLSDRRSRLSVLNALWVGSGLLAELSAMVYLFTPTYTGVPFADAAPAWFTNQLLGIVSGLSVASITIAEVYFRTLGSYHPDGASTIDNASPSLSG